MLRENKTVIALSAQLGSALCLRLERGRASEDGLEDVGYCCPCLAKCAPAGAVLHVDGVEPVL